MRRLEDEAVDGRSGVANCFGSWNGWDDVIDRMAIGHSLLSGCRAGGGLSDEDLPSVN